MDFVNTAMLNCQLTKFPLTQPEACCDSSFRAMQRKYQYAQNIY